MLFKENANTKFKIHIFQLQNALNIFIYQKHICSSVYSDIKGMICRDYINTVRAAEEKKCCNEEMNGCKMMLYQKINAFFSKNNL